MGYAEVLADEQAVTTVGFLERARAWFATCGIRCRALLSDNGSNCRSHLVAAWCRAARLRHRFTRPYRPQTNGKAERFIRTLLHEWAYARAYGRSAFRTRGLSPYLQFYNTERPHTALGYLTPLQRLAQRSVNNVFITTPSPSASRPPGPHGLRVARVSSWRRGPRQPGEAARRAEATWTAPLSADSHRAEYGVAPAVDHAAGIERTEVLLSGAHQQEPHTPLDGPRRHVRGLGLIAAQAARIGTPAEQSPRLGQRAGVNPAARHGHERIGLGHDDRARCRYPPGHVWPVRADLSGHVRAPTVRWSSAAMAQSLAAGFSRLARCAGRSFVNGAYCDPPPRLVSELRLGRGCLEIGSRFPSERSNRAILYHSLSHHTRLFVISRFHR